jgi:hypothetical protein
MFATIRGLALFTAFGLIAATMATAQTAPPSVPLPVQLASAKKIFVSNASGESYSGMSASDLTYSDFYSALKSWGRYELAPTPADADLIFEVRYEVPAGPANRGDTWGFPQVRLSIFDPKTHTILWAFCEQMTSTKNKSNQDHLDETLNNLLNDVKKLVVPPAVTAVLSESHSSNK